MNKCQKNNKNHFIIIFSQYYYYKKQIQTWYWILMQMWIWKWIYPYPNKIMLANFSNSIPICQLRNLEILTNCSNVLLHYRTWNYYALYQYIYLSTIIKLAHYNTWVYYFLVFVSAPNWKISDPYSYLNNIRSEFVFDNIRIRIRIRFENVETDMGMALSDPHPIRFHP